MIPDETMKNPEIIKICQTLPNIFATFKGVKEGGSVNCSDWRGSLRTCKIVTSWLGSPQLQKPSCCKKRRRHKRKSKSVTTPLNPEAAAAICADDDLVQPRSSPSAY